MLTIRNTAPENFPESVTINGETFPLYYTIAPQYAEAWAFMLVDGMPIATISMLYGNIYQFSLERAEAMLKSFRKNDNKLCFHYASPYSIFDRPATEQVSGEGAYNEALDCFSMDIVSDPAFTVEVYTTTLDLEDVDSPSKLCKKVIHSLFISNDKDIRYSVFDKETIKAVIATYNNRVHTTRRITSDSHGLPFDLTGE
jgi:hypothetical protein